MESIVDRAIVVAAGAHRDQVRKGTDIPYITHPFSVAMLLAGCGCSEEVIAAGILHDVVEDTAITLKSIRTHFGEKVASIVEGCSEPDRSLSWEARKRHTISYLRDAPVEVKWVACVDKLHNIRTIASEYERIGEDVWSRFKRGREEQAWYYRSLVESLCNGFGAQESPELFLLLKGEVEALFGEE